MFPGLPGLHGSLSVVFLIPGLQEFTAPSGLLNTKT